jgi:hypothetical protein
MPSITRGTTATGARIAGQGWWSRLQSTRGGDVGGDRDNVDDAISASILDSDGDGITGHGDDGVVPSLASNARRGGGSNGGVNDATGNDGNDNTTMGRRWRSRRRTPRRMRRVGGWR